MMGRVATGADADEILRAHPVLEPGDITAALEFAARHADDFLGAAADKAPG